jgi:hypothetical protein
MPELDARVAEIAAHAGTAAYDAANGPGSAEREVIEESRMG